MEICPDCMSGQNNCIEPDCEIQGECNGKVVHEHDSVNTIEDCINLCKNTSNCNWFTFHTELSLCSLFETCFDVDTSCETCISGENTCRNTARISNFPTEKINSAATTKLQIATKTASTEPSSAASTATTTIASTAATTISSTLSTTMVDSTLKITPKDERGDHKISLQSS